MIADMLTIINKEWKELLLQRGRFRGGWVGMIFFLLVFGVFMPLQSGPGWVSSPASILYWAWVPFLLVSSVIADSFAGERERQTLETLLASRLSDKAILFGKTAAAISYGWGFTLLSLLLGLVTLNLVNRQEALILYPPKIGLAIIVVSFLVAWLASGLGTLISLRAPTVRQAQQTFSIAFALLFIPLLAFPMLPQEFQGRVILLIAQTDLQTIGLLVLAGVLVLNLLLTGLSLLRFTRSKLILD